jgi:curved DNA-binding protein CbpA
MSPMSPEAKRQQELFTTARLNRQRKPPVLSQTADPYAVLGLERGADQAEIRQAYFELVRQHPPEKDAETFKIIRAAYEKLRTAAAQAETDLFLLQAPPDLSELRVALEFDCKFHPEDVLLALMGWCDLSRKDFSDDFGEVPL